MEDAVREILKYVGEDPNREGLLNTPKRVRIAYEYLTNGYKMSVKSILNGALFNVKYDEMVTVKNIDFFSLCEHHLLPFYGKCHVAYIPNGKIIGISKIPRIVDMFSRRLQVQERLTTQIANTIEELIHPRGVGVIMRAKHLCMIMRGVEKQNTEITTSTMHGILDSDQASKDEFIKLTQTP